MKILVIGDTHAQDDIFLTVLERERPFDVLLHTGDFEGSEIVYKELADVPFYYVAGNNDFFTDAPFGRVVVLDGCRVFMTHGHVQDVDTSYDGVRAEALRRHAKIAVFGHTHLPLSEYRGEVLLLNPGSLSWPRQEGRQYSYAILEIDSGRVISYEIRFLP